MGDGSSILEAVGLMLSPDFWKGKRVFLTGHTGFKGSWLSFLLHHLESNVTGYALDPTPDSDVFEKLGIAEKVQDLRGDVRDLAHISTALETSQPEVVLHLAAQSIVRTSFDQPLETISTNALGTANLLEACRSVSSLRSLLIVTSDKCYKNTGESTPFSEADPLGGNDLYSASKACTEIISEAFRVSFFERKSLVGLATARAGNVIGGGDWARDRILPDAIRAFNENKVLKVRNPTAIRPWQHVLEPLSGYLLLAECLYNDPHKFSSSWNFGPNPEDSVPVGALCDLIIKAHGGGASWQTQNEAGAPPEAPSLRLSTEKALRELRWAPRWNLESAVARTIEWYIAARAGENVAALTQNQIAEYLGYQS